MLTSAPERGETLKKHNSHPFSKPVHRAYEISIKPRKLRSLTSRFVCKKSQKNEHLTSSLLQNSLPNFEPIFFSLLGKLLKRLWSSFYHELYERKDSQLFKGKVAQKRALKVVLKILVGDVTLKITKEKRPETFLLKLPKQRKENGFRSLYLCSLIMKVVEQQGKVVYIRIAISLTFFTFYLVICPFDFSVANRMIIIS